MAVTGFERAFCCARAIQKVIVFLPRRNQDGALEKGEHLGFVRLVIAALSLDFGRWGFDFHVADGAYG